MTEPKTVRAGLDMARRALEEAAARPARGEPVPLDDDTTTDDVARMVQETAEARRQQRWELVCPRRFRGASLEWVLAEHGHVVYEQLTAWATAAERVNLVLLGPVGTGKTSAALAACKADQLDHGAGVAFHPVAELLDLLRPGGPDDSMARLTAAPRLIVDDVGTERVTDWTAERMSVLINRRWMEELPTIATSNLQPKELCEAMGERAYSRLVGGALVIELSGKDRRRNRG
ncbi:MAG: hypothetical protein SHS37scaffold145_24 [Phage 71_18]|nr:MAG: hypothetical protein SHS37scaffold145_24 [Phage 71_18]